MTFKLTMLAIIPGILIIIYVYRKDKVEKEPIGLITKIIIFGALSALAAMVLESIVAKVMPQYAPRTLGYALTTAFCQAAFCEELVKYLAMKWGSWKYVGFNYRFDGVVYGVSSAVGFALLENVLYVAQFGLSAAITRAFTAVPLHAFCGVAMGIFYSYAKKASIQGKSRAGFTILALLVPIMIHGIYDALAFLGTQATTYMLLGFVLILYIVAIKTIKKLSIEDYKEGFYPEAREIHYTEF